MERGNLQPKLLYTVAEAALLTSISRAHLYRLILAGRLATIQIGRSRRITANQLAAFVRSLEENA